MAAVGVRELVEAHYQPLYRYAYRLSGSAADAEDLTQEAFGKAVERLGQLRDPAKARHWLFRIVRNAYLHAVRDAKRARAVPLDSVGDVAAAVGEESPLADVDPDRLQAALNDLDESFRTPLILFYFDDFSYKDIADQMDLPIGTVMSRLARGKAHLRAKLARHVAPAAGD